MGKAQQTELVKQLHPCPVKALLCEPAYEARPRRSVGEQPHNTNGGEAMTQIGQVQLLEVGFGSGAKVEGRLMDELAKLRGDIIAKDDFRGQEEAAPQDINRAGAKCAEQKIVTYPLLDASYLVDSLDPSIGVA
jgi:hypothetical protein